MGEGEIHIWRLNLDLNDDLLMFFEKKLSKDEIHKADQFYFNRDRNRFIASHGWLREILGQYVQMEPERLLFSYNIFGKPSLENVPGEHCLHFNLSHSREIGLLALCLDRRIGVDVEYIRPDLDEVLIAQRFFSTYEVTTLLTLPNHLKKEAFFNCWTRKEAYIKARGEGLNFSLDRVIVTLIPGEAAIILSVLSDSDEASRWSLLHIDPEPGYVAAVAVEGKLSRIRYLLGDDSSEK